MATTDDTNAQDRADMARLVAGHDAALNDLMMRHAAPAFQFLCRMLGNEDDANDLAQEVFIRVYQHREKFHAAERFTTWFYTIAANLARNHHRWRSRHPNVSLDAESDTTKQSLGDVLPSADPPPSQAADSAERATVVRAAVAFLTHLSPRTARRTFMPAA